MAAEDYCEELSWPQKPSGINALFDHDEETRIFKADVPKKPYFRPMYSAWMSEIPLDLRTHWLVKFCPNGKRCIVVAHKNRTKVYAKKGRIITEFYSALPGGNHSVNSERYTVLDCLFNDQELVFYVLDVIAWNCCSYTKVTAEARFFILENKIAEMPEIKELSSVNEYRFLHLPYITFNAETLQEWLSQPFILEDLETRVDGLLFYQKEGIYLRIVSSFALWIKPFLLPDMFGIQVADTYLEHKPNNYITAKEYIEQQVEEQVAKRNAKRTPQKSKANSSEQWKTFYQSSPRAPKQLFKKENYGCGSSKQSSETTGTLNYQQPPYMPQQQVYPQPMYVQPYYQPHYYQAPVQQYYQPFQQEFYQATEQQLPLDQQFNVQQLPATQQSLNPAAEQHEVDIGEEVITSEGQDSENSHQIPEPQHEQCNQQQSYSQYTPSNQGQYQQMPTQQTYQHPYQEQFQQPPVQQPYQQPPLQQTYLQLPQYQYAQPSFVYNMPAYLPDGSNYKATIVNDTNYFHEERAEVPNKPLPQVHTNFYNYSTHEQSSYNTMLNPNNMVLHSQHCQAPYQPYYASPGPSYYQGPSNQGIVWPSTNYGSTEGSLSSNQPSPPARSSQSENVPESTSSAQNPPSKGSSKKEKTKPTTNKNSENVSNITIETSKNTNYDKGNAGRTENANSFKYCYRTKYNPQYTTLPAKGQPCCSHSWWY